MIDTALILSAIILILTGAFLRFFKYTLTPEIVNNLSYILLFEIVILLILIALKILKGIKWQQ
ncbi:hypothetical protein JCM15786_17430 [Nautilia lithotrophica]